MQFTGNGFVVHWGFGLGKIRWPMTQPRDNVLHNLCRIPFGAHYSLLASLNH